MKFAVTGGAGFIGSNIVEELVDRGEAVLVIDNLFAGKKENLEPFMSDIEFVKGDIRDQDLLMELFEDVDYVLHQAAIGSVPRSLEQPVLYNDVNISGTVNVLEAAKENDVKRVVFASSSSVYGNADVPWTEGEEGDQISPYAITKRTCEKYMQLYYELHGLETVCLRYFNVFGPRQDPNAEYAAVIPLFIKAIANDERPTIFGDGEQTRDFTYVKNVVEGNLKACTAEDAPGEVINLANGNPITINELAEDINDVFDKNIEPVHDDPRPGDIRHSHANPKKAKNILDYEEKVSFKQGLKKTVEWFEQDFQ